jgi:UDP-N-acetylmuramoyl-L-alanyl-D-glutamate--2,6-diaminopimelate ligase
MELGEVRGVLEGSGLPGGAVVLGSAGREHEVVTGITHDSRAVRPGDLFACLRGEHHDGHEYAAVAAAAGAIGLLVDHELVDPGPDRCVQFVVDDTRVRLGPLAAAVHGHPSRRLRTVGITGTNGKTTTAQMTAAIFDHAGWETGVVGTLHGRRTTPEAPDLQALLARFVEDGRVAAVLEVSSHALALHRVDGTEFDAVVFTNFGHDHLDLHGSAEAYFRAKARLFDRAFAPLAVINVDDPHGRLLADTLADGSTGPRVVPYEPGDATDVDVRPDRVRFRWRGRPIEVAIGGRVNIENAVAALTTAVELGIDPATAAAALDELPPVPGRFQVVSSPAAAARGVTVVVDYAHTPDGLERLLEDARPLVGAGGALRVVFGCGGERDHAKRPEMGEVAARLADDVVVTSDNPRHEDPGRILDDVLQGVPARYRSRVDRDVDRRSAIGAALARSGRGDVVVIAGKGHERTQDLGTATIDFDDVAVARTLLEDRS